MSGPGATPLFIDTGAFYARIDDRDDDHEQACAVFDAIEAGDLPYRPLYTTGYVLGELVALALSRADHALAATALERIRSSDRVQVIHPGAETFAAVCEEFHRYDDHAISLVDHMTGTLAAERDVEHVFTFDPDHFRTLGLTPVPADTGEP